MRTQETAIHMQRVPQFSVGDLVSEKAAMPKRVSIVVQIYEFDGETRFVVRFEDGSESVFFAFELVAADKAAGQAG